MGRVKVLNSKMSTDWGLCFLCQEAKRKDVMRRAPTYFENLIDRVKEIVQLEPTVDLFRIDEGTGNTNIKQCI